MKKILTVALLALSLTMWGQTGLRIVESDTRKEKKEGREIVNMTFCLPLVATNDSMITLICGGVKVHMRQEKLAGEVTLVIRPNEKDGSLKAKETVHWYLASKSYYRDSLDMKFIEYSGDMGLASFNSNVNIEIPSSKVNGELTVIIHPSEEDGPLKYKQTVNWNLPPKSEYGDILRTDLN